MIYQQAIPAYATMIFALSIRKRTGKKKEKGVEEEEEEEEDGGVLNFEEDDDDEDGVPPAPGDRNTCLDI